MTALSLTHYFNTMQEEIKTEHMIELQKQMYAMQGDCKVEKERHNNIMQQVEKIWITLKELDQRLNAMEKRWAQLLGIAMIVQLIGIPLILKFILK